MKKTIAFCCLFFATLVLFAQSWNPYVSQGIISPASILPMEFNGSGVVSFNIGNTGSSPLTYSPNNPMNGMSLVITLSCGVPNKNNPIAAVGGTWFSYFDWTYDESINTFIATQKRTIPGSSQGNITIDYKVTTNTPLAVAGNGFNINIQPPPYANGSNNTQDDAVSSYTFTRAYDYGDAPASYGTARHEIDVTRDPETNLYNRYIYLGKKVDQEPGAFSSPIADGDDKAGTDDEDGVTFPVLKAGTTVSIPFEVTAHDMSSGYLNAWFDWNGDGDFLDAGEKVTPTPVSIFSSGNYVLQVAIPTVAITSGPTFARFRIGANSGPTAANAWGEAEDYQVMILPSVIVLYASQVNVTNFGESTGSVNLNVSGGKMPYVFNWSNGSATKDLTNLPAGIYTVVVKDATNALASTTVTITQPDQPIVMKVTIPNSVLLEGNRVGNDIVLNWITESENNTLNFILERSTDGSEFTAVGSAVQAAGTSEVKLTYNYVDNLILNELAMYRVTLTETNGNTLLSNTVSLALDDRAVFQMAVYPNPIKHEYTVAIGSAGSYQLDLFDSMGILVTTEMMEVGPGGNCEKQFLRDGTITGTYFLRAIEKRTGKTNTVAVIMLQ